MCIYLGIESITRPVDASYNGIVYFDVYAPKSVNPLYAGPPSSLVVCPIAACQASAAYEMGGEVCQQQGNAWRVLMDDATTNATVDIFPAFGFETGATSVLLPALYSPQLDNTRDVAVYVPSTVSQNKASCVCIKQTHTHTCFNIYPRAYCQHVPTCCYRISECTRANACIHEAVCNCNPPLIPPLFRLVYLNARRWSPD